MVLTLRAGPIAIVMVTLVRRHCRRGHPSKLDAQSSPRLVSPNIPLVIPGTLFMILSQAAKPHRLESIGDSILGHGFQIP